MATYTVDKIGYNNNEYVLQDSGALQLTGGSVTGPVTFGDSVSADDVSIGTLSVTGSATFANNIQANKINNVTVGSSPKFTDTVTTVTTTGSGNAITSITASNGVITATKGSTFITSADITVLTNTSASVTLTANGSASKWKVVDSFNTLTVGKWLVIIGVEFSSNTADRNVCVLSSTSSTTSTDAWESDDAIAWTKYMSFVKPVSGSVTNIIFPVYLDITTNNPTIYIKAYQNSSSSSVTAHASYTAIKIG